MIRFTKQEKIVLLFLLAALFAGTAVLYCKKLNPKPYRVIEFEAKEIERLEKININTAGMGELMKIKGVGPVLAERIILYRRKNGPFRDAEDIKDVRGIGGKTYEKIREQIVVE